MIVIKRTEADEQALAGSPPIDLTDDGKNWLEVKVKKPWGYEIEKYRDQHCSLTVLCVEPSQATSMHCHVHKAATLYICKGTCFINTLDTTHYISAGNVVSIENGAFHQIAGGTNGVKLYELETPANKNDLVRLADRYGRGQGYECLSATR